MKKISVAMCTYNGSRFVKEQLESIFSQTHLPDEIIICDDNSTDNTVDIAREILNNENIDYKIIINIENLGVIKNFEQAIKCCSGDIIFTCDQDDVWLPQKIEKMQSQFLGNNDYMAVFSNATLVNENLDSLNVDLWSTLKFNSGEIINKEEQLIKVLLKHCVVTGAALAFRREVFDEMLPFSKYWIHDGWIAILLSLKDQIIPLNEELLLYRQHSNNVIGASDRNLINKISVYFSNLKEIEKVRNNRLNRYKDVKRYIDDKDIVLDINIINAINECIDFWERKTKLSSVSLFSGTKIIIKDYFNKSYVSYYSGFAGAIRDILKLFLKKLRVE